jgi:hypothetical protein
VWDEEDKVEVNVGDGEPMGGARGEREREAWGGRINGDKNGGVEGLVHRRAGGGLGVSAGWTK